MTITAQAMNRRVFLKNLSLSAGGLVIGFTWLESCQENTDSTTVMPSQWFELNGFVKIGDTGLVTIQSPNPEGGQNIKTSMPMIVAEELDVDWKQVVVEQAPLNTALYSRQFIGGSQAIRQGWTALRQAGATARQMLRLAAAEIWNVPVEEVTTQNGQLLHSASGKKAMYGDLADAAAKQHVPESVPLKSPKKFSIIGTSPKNVDGQKIVTGQPLFGSDYRCPGMLIAMIVHPPAFGLKLKSFDDTSVRSMPGMLDVFSIKVLQDDYQRQYFDTCTFTEVVALVGKTTWEVMQAKKSLKIEWEVAPARTESRNAFGTIESVQIPKGLENTTGHQAAMVSMSSKPAVLRRRDGDPETAFKQAAKVIECTYTAPFLAHNCMEPMNFFAHVTNERALLIGPLQKAELTEQALSTRLGMPKENIEIQMTRLGGGYGRRSYAHWLIEAALISQKIQAPVKLIYTREDDMTGGIYRPAYQAVYRAGLDAQNNLIAFQVKAGGIPESPLYAHRFPAGAVDHYLAEDWTIPSNITVGSFRAPRSNFIAAAEQCFLDEVAEAAGQDPLAFRLALLERTKSNPVGKDNDYDAARYAAVLELVRDKSGWGQGEQKVARGVSAYYCHNTYVAHVLDLELQNGKTVVTNVCSAVDCGLVIHPDSAKNMTEGSIVDGIGCALYGQLTIKEGELVQQNFDQYRLIRHSEAPKNIEVHFVENDHDPTGMGEPPFPPVFAALANALYKATGKRFYEQPFGQYPVGS